VSTPPRQWHAWNGIFGSLLTDFSPATMICLLTYNPLIDHRQGWSHQRFSSCSRLVIVHLRANGALWPGTHAVRWYCYMLPLLPSTFHKSFSNKFVLEQRTMSDSPRGTFNERPSSCDRRRLFHSTLRLTEQFEVYKQREQLTFVVLAEFLSFFSCFPTCSYS
jgi:hypothetical protein